MSPARGTTHGRSTQVPARIDIDAVTLLQQLGHDVLMSRIGGPNERRVARAIGSVVTTDKFAGRSRDCRRRCGLRDRVLAQFRNAGNLKVQIELPCQFVKAIADCVRFGRGVKIQPDRGDAGGLSKLNVVGVRIANHDDRCGVEIPLLPNGMHTGRIRFGRIRVIARHDDFKSRQIGEFVVHAIDGDHRVARDQGHRDVVVRQPLQDFGHAWLQLQRLCCLAFHVLDDVKFGLDLLRCEVGGVVIEIGEDVVVFGNLAARVHVVEVQVGDRERAVHVEDDALQCGTLVLVICCVISHCRSCRRC
mmetsp:Transcript_11708/g.32286  ORF Transcript_11708/g.32286 Transcript_11708/m.32286 type:complete len:304 (-) Transcript_11708:42-953(-)